MEPGVVGFNLGDIEVIEKLPEQVWSDCWCDEFFLINFPVCFHVSLHHNNNYYFKVMIVIVKISTFYCNI